MGKTLSAFTKKSRPIAHPDWLRGALNDFSRTQRLYLSGILPKAIEFPMVTVPLHRLLRCCFGGNWSIVWWALDKAVYHEWERLQSACWRFWHYRVLMESQDVELKQDTLADVSKMRQPLPLQCSGWPALGQRSDE